MTREVTGMIRIFTLKTGYAVALAAAAASGSLVAIANSAGAQAATAPVAAAALQGVTLSSAAKVERVVKAPDGSEKIVYKTPKEVIVTPGDKVVFTLSYQNKGKEPASGFRATNPMPGAIQFIEAAEDWALVSVDGGKTFGLLKDLSVSERVEEAAIVDAETGEETQAATSEMVKRAATAGDVTHVRWAFSDAILPGQKGSVSYRGIVK